MATGESSIEGLSDFHIKIDDTTTMVMIAKVYLAIGDLRYQEGYLVGNYSIDVPLRPAKSEDGTMRLPLHKSVHQFFSDGGEIKGVGNCFNKDNENRIIICKVFPDKLGGREGVIKLEIDTGSRELKFSSRYKVLGNPPDNESLYFSERPF
jgi:hypothetical protein